MTSKVTVPHRSNTRVRDFLSTPPKETKILTLEKIKPPTIEDYYIRACLLGDSGTGKTTGALTLPGRKLVIDCDNRAESIAGMPNVVAVHKVLEPFGKPTPGQSDHKPRAWEELKLIKADLWELAKLPKEERPFDSVSFDSITAMCRFAMNWSLTLTRTDGVEVTTSPGGGPSRPHYAPAMHEISNFIISCLSLPFNVLFNGHIQFYENEEKRIVGFFPRIIGNLRDEAPNWFNETYQTTRKISRTGPPQYLWHTAGTAQMQFFKSSINQFGKFWQDPLAMNVKPIQDKTKARPAGFERLLELRFGEEVKKLYPEWPSTVQAVN